MLLQRPSLVLLIGVLNKAPVSTFGFALNRHGCRRFGFALNRHGCRRLSTASMPGDGGGDGDECPLLRVAVVGGGSISREFALHHFGAATGTIVSAVVDIDKARAEELAVDVGSIAAGAAIEDGGGTRYRAAAAEVRGEPVPFATSLGAVLAGCDVVYIGTTPGAHAPLALEALEAGKHVLLEKPLASSAADADAIVDAAEAASARGQHVGMNIGMRWNPGLHELRRLALGPERALGELTSARLSMHFRQVNDPQNPLHLHASVV